MIAIDSTLDITALKPQLDDVLALGAQKVRLIEAEHDNAAGTPVFTVNGKYTSRGWTEWTQGFQYGCALLAWDALDDAELLEIGRENTIRYMASHVSHVGVHDHGFNNVSTYGNLLRLMREGRIPENAWERHFYEMALKMSGAVQASRWTDLPDGLGFIQSFCGPHSLFSDTIRTVRSLAMAHQLGHVLMGEKDKRINLLLRLLQHAETTAQYNVYYGEGRDSYDIRGRVVHESIFNLHDGCYRCPSTQQGYSPYTTWTRGHSWILAGYPEELEYLATLDEAEFQSARELGLYADKNAALQRFRYVAEAAADFYIDQTPVDGIPYWDTGAPGLARMGDYLDRPAEPYNEHEPVDSSAAVIAAQGLLRLGRYLEQIGATEQGRRYWQAGLTVARSLFADPYLSRNPQHQGLLLHAVYHRPNGWDHIPEGQSVPCGESCMWGDYHALELAVYLHRIVQGQPEYQFFA
jgi:unsaturated chondroitin disaccharide hydrolase